MNTSAILKRLSILGVSAAVTFTAVFFFYQQTNPFNHSLQRTNSLLAGLEQLHLVQPRKQNGCLSGETEREYLKFINSPAFAGTVLGSGGFIFLVLSFVFEGASSKLQGDRR